MSLDILPPVLVETITTQGAEETRQQVQTLLKQAALDGTMTPPRHFQPSHDGYWDGYSYEIDPAFPDLAADIARHREGLSDTGA